MKKYLLKNKSKSLGRFVGEGLVESLLDNFKDDEEANKKNLFNENKLNSKINKVIKYRETKPISTKDLLKK